MSAVCANQPVAYWRLDEASGGSVADSSGNGHAGTLSASGVTLGSPGALAGDTAASFNGSTGAISVASTTGLPSGNHSYSLEAWINTTANVLQGIIGWGNYGTNGRVNALRMEGAFGLRNYWWNNDLLASTPNLANGAWHHVVATFDASADARAIYLDGVLVGSDQPVFPNIALDNVTIAATVAGENFPNPEYFSGALDEVAVYDHALTTSQIRSHYTAAGFTVSAPTPPGAPTNVTEFGGGTSGTVAWTAPISDGGATIDRYDVSLAQTNGQGTPQTARVTDLSNLSATFTGLTSGAQYTASVTAHNAAGSGAAATTTFTTTTYTVDPQYAVSDWAVGFPYSCCGPIGLAFDSSNHLYVSDRANGGIYRFGANGGLAGLNLLSGTPIAGAPHGLAFDRSGNLYAALAEAGTVVQLNTTTGAIVRTVASGLGSPLGLGVDPISGDLFVGAGYSGYNVARISNFANGPGTVTGYSAPGGVDGLTIGPDGTIYVEANGCAVRVAGTNTPNPGQFSTIACPNNAMDGIAIAANPSDPGHPPFIFANGNWGSIVKIDLTGPSPVQSTIFSGGSRGDFVTVGPDGCLYATQTDRVIKLTNADGTCSLANTSVVPQLGLAPATASGTTGTPLRLTATLENVSSPGGTPVTFTVSGANPQSHTVNADATGKAAFTYTGAAAGTDRVVAAATAGGASLTSNQATVVWSASVVGSLQVRKTVNWNGVTPDATQSFQLCISGPSYPTTPNCQNVGSTGGALTWSNLIPGGYTVSETNSGTQWSVAGSGASVSVPTDGTQATATVTNTRKLGSLQVTKTVDWSGSTPVTTQAFQLCVNGPSYPTGAESGACQNVGSNGGTLTWSNLVPGTYTVTETHPGAQWSVAVSGSPATVPADGGQARATVANTLKPGAVKVTKTVRGVAPSGTQAFTFQLRQGASATQAGTTLESQIANAANKGVIPFATSLTPGQTYQLCEVVMPGWLTSLGTFAPNSFLPPDGAVANPAVDNSTLCINVTAVAGQTSTYAVDNTPPPGGRALTIGFWKNWASCANANGKQKPVLDQTLYLGTITLSATSGSYPLFDPTYYLRLTDTSTDANKASDCQAAVSLLNKSTISTGKKSASDPAFNLASQLLAAQLNYAAGAGRTPAATRAINQAVLLLGKYQFDGNTHKAISAADATTMNNLATTLDNYNNGR
jgi:hypothetical protein